MANILIPRSDSISVKTIEPSDFTEMFYDVINDYIVSGFTLSAGSGLSANIAIGKARLKGLFVHNTSSSSKGSLTANDVNYIYITLARDSNSEAESWSFTSNLTGTTPTDSLFIGTATTNGSSVTAVDIQTNVQKYNGRIRIWGDGSDGARTVSSSTTIDEAAKLYTTFTLNSGVTLTASERGMTIFANESITINGTIDCSGKGTLGEIGSVSVPAVGGNGGGNVGGHAGGVGANSSGAAEAAYVSTGKSGGSGGAGGGGGFGSTGGLKLGGAGGAAGTVFNGNAFTAKNYKIFITFLTTPALYGAGGGGGSSGGGGGGGGDSPAAGGNGATGNGGNGGNGGGYVVLIAPLITIASTAVINTNAANGTNASGTGSNGSNGTNNSEGGGGGGGGNGGGSGGNGGAILFLSDTLTEAAGSSLTIAGGTGGTGTAGGQGGSSSGTNDTAGVGGGAGSNGQTGNNGIIKRFSL